MRKAEGRSLVSKNDGAITGEPAPARSVTAGRSGPRAGNGPGMPVLRAAAEQLIGKFRKTIDSISSDLVPVVLCSASVRRHLRYLVERFMPNVVVLSHNEIPTDFKIRSLGLIGP